VPALLSQPAQLTPPQRFQQRPQAAPPPQPAIERVAPLPAELGCAEALSFGLSAEDAAAPALAALCASEFGATQVRFRVCEGFEARLAEVSSLARDGALLAEAFVSFVSGEGYAELAAEAVEAAHEASQRPVLLFAGGAVGEGGAAARLWPPARFPRLVVLAMPAATLHPWFDKLRAALRAPARRAVVLEADSLATPHVDRLFALLARDPRYALPLLPVHPHLRWPSARCAVGPDGAGVTRVQLDAADARTRACGAPFDVPLERRSTPYGHAHFVFSAAAKPFLAELLLACAASGGGGRPGSFDGAPLDCSSDEAALNVALWARRAPRQLCLFDPPANVVGAWEARSWRAGGIAPHRAESFETHTVAFLVLHGAKQPAEARALRARIAAAAANASAAWASHRGEWVAPEEGEWKGVEGCEL
jgi:hypothetical protein